MNIPMKMLIKLLLYVFVTIFGQMSVLPQVSVQPEAFWKQPHSILVQVDTEVRTEKGFLYYGELVIKLPQGVEAVEQKPGPGDGDAGTVIDLVKDKYNSLAPRIWITHYTMGDYNEWAMTSALLDQLPETTLCLCCSDGEEDINFFTYTRGYIKGYVLSRGNDIYLIEEVCDEAAFGRMLDYQFVSWAGGSPVYAENQGDAAWFDRFAAGEMFFLAVRYTAEDGSRWIVLMQDGKYGQVYQKIAVERKVSSERLICRDYNFDGYTDINFSSEILYLWNPDTELYEETPVPEEFMQLQSEALFPDTEVIWGYHSGTDAELQYDKVETETLWQWEGKELVKKRVCKAQTRGETVQLLAYEIVGEPTPKYAMAQFDEAVPLETYQQGSPEVQKLYAQFYDEMVPAETYARVHVREYDKEHIQYIPQELLELNVDILSQKAEPWEYVQRRTGNWLSEKEILAVAKENADLRGAVARAAVQAVKIDYTMIMVDGDNDGIGDIIAQEVSASSIGNDGLKDYVFYQGQADGTYVKTDVYTSVQNEFAIINYEGKNYLRCAYYEQDKDRYGDVSILCFAEGKGVEQADIELIPENYNIKPAQYTQKEYSPYVERLAADALLYKAALDAGGVIVGSCEEELPEYEEYPYQCDLNNDSAAEQYTKNLYHADNVNRSGYIHFDGKGEGVEVVNDALYSLADTPAMIWAETYGGKNIVNMMVRTGLEDFDIVCFQLTGQEYEKICGVCAAADYSVGVRGRLLAAVP